MHRKTHGLEKIQVQLTTMLALGGVYFGLWAAVRSWDPQGPIVFFPTGGYTQLLIFAVVVWLLAVVCALLTVSARPAGTVLVLLFAAAGFSLKSPPIRSLLWLRDTAVRGLYGELMLEVAALAAVLLVAVLLARWVRKLVAAIRPTWAWRDPLANLTDEQRRTVQKAFAEEQKKASAGGEAMRLFLMGLPAAVLYTFGPAGSGRSARKLSRAETWSRTAVCLATAGAIALVLLLLFMRSADRGQILAALAASLGIGMLLAHQLFPAPVGLLACILPFAMALVLYALAGLSAVATGPLAWTEVPHYARALPIDWLTAGGGGALLGYWISARIHEIRILEKAHHDEKEKEDG